MSWLLPDTIVIAGGPGPSKEALRVSAGCDRGQQIPVGLAGVEE